MHPKIYLSNKKGFTLIEIMASLVIIGVLASVGVQKHDQISDSATPVKESWNMPIGK
jgi:prepilin-type N-terminal cleavage/methylation domain-containing protein